MRYVVLIQSLISAGEDKYRIVATAIKRTIQDRPYYADNVRLAIAITNYLSEEFWGMELDTGEGPLSPESILVDEFFASIWTDNTRPGKTISEIQQFLRDNLRFAP